MRSGYLFGVFDLFHLAHLDALSAAADATGDRVVVGVASDELVEQLSGGRPYVPFAERIEIVGAVRAVAEVRRLDSLNELMHVDRLGIGPIFLPGDDLDVVQTAAEPDLAALAARESIALHRLPAGRRTTAVAVLDALSRLNESEVA
jgi:cytidyltransferase-like protein